MVHMVKYCLLSEFLLEPLQRLRYASTLSDGPINSTRSLALCCLSFLRRICLQVSSLLMIRHFHQVSAVSSQNITTHLDCVGSNLWLVHPPFHSLSFGIQTVSPGYSGGNSLALCGVHQNSSRAFLDSLFFLFHFNS